MKIALKFDQGCEVTEVTAPDPPTEIALGVEVDGVPDPDAFVFVSKGSAASVKVTITTDPPVPDNGYILPVNLPQKKTLLNFSFVGGVSIKTINTSWEEGEYKLLAEDIAPYLRKKYPNLPFVINNKEAIVGIY